MGSTRLLLVRHGQTADNLNGRLTGRSDTDLTPAGVRETRYLARFVAANCRVDCLYSSPQRRALRTAEIIAQTVGVEPSVVNGLREIDFGDIEGASFKDIEALFPGVFAKGWDPDDPEFRWPNGESRSELRARAIKALDEIVDQNQERTVLVITHGAPASAYLCHLFDANPNAWSKHWVETSSLTEVQFVDGKAELVRFNDRSFIPTPKRRRKTQEAREGEASVEQ